MNAPQETTEHQQTIERLCLSLRTPGFAEVAAPFVDARALSGNHVQLVDILGHAAGETDPTVLLVAALVLSAQERGHSALSLRPDLLPRMVPARPTDPNQADAVTAALPWPRWTDVKDPLARSPLLTGEPELLSIHEHTHMGPALQTHRLDREEQWVADSLLALCEPVPATETRFLPLTDQHYNFATGLFKDKEGTLDPKHPALEIFKALQTARLGIVTGGPGTGKTWTIKRILSVFHAAAAIERPDKPFTVALAAPTGKAGVRMREAMQEELEDLTKHLSEASTTHGLAVDATQIAQTLKGHSSFTLHKLLGIRPGEGSARHHKDNPLPYDMVVVDEASMADLPMMRRLLQAIGPTTRLVLLGDRDQLPSVDVGAVLSDLVSPTKGQTDARLPVTWFHKNHRSANAQTLADLVQELKTGTDIEQSMDYLMGRKERQARMLANGKKQAAERMPGERIRRIPPPRPMSGGATEEHEGTHDQLVETLLAPWLKGEEDEKGDDARELPDNDGYVTLLADLLKETKKGESWKNKLDQNTEALFHAFDAYRVLAVHRKGPLGVAGLGAALEKKIRNKLEAAWQKRLGTAPSTGSTSDHKLPTQSGKWLGQAILITRNDPDLGVYNGDVGLVLPMLPPKSDDSARQDAHDNKQKQRDKRPLALALPRIPDAKDESKFRSIPLSRLPEHESAFVMTVHKSQGSQFDHTAVVLADRASSIQTRELVYTGITRAKEQVTWVGTEATMRAALTTRVVRGSLLERRVTGEEPDPIPETEPPDGTSPPAGGPSGGSGPSTVSASSPTATGSGSAPAVDAPVAEPTLAAADLPDHYDGLHSFLLKHMPVDGALKSRTELNKAAKTARGMSVGELDALLHNEPRVERVRNSWRLRETAPVKPGCPLDRATKAVLASETGLSGREIMDAAELTKDEWNTLRLALVHQPAVESVGFRRGARYLPKAHFEQRKAEIRQELRDRRKAEPREKTVLEALREALGGLNER